MVSVPDVLISKGFCGQGLHCFLVLIWHTLIICETVYDVLVTTSKHNLCESPHKFLMCI